MALAEDLLEFAFVLLQSIYYILESIYVNLWPSGARLKDVKGQTVLVTGAGSGLGRLMSLRFAWLGTNIVLWDLNKESCEETARQVREIGAKAYPYQCDLSDRESVYKVAKQVQSEVGDIDILVNNAGVVSGKKFMDCSDKLIEKTMEVNVMAHFWTVKSFLPAMITKNHGHIVTIASCAGVFGVNGLADYCASKFAAVGFDDSLREELFAMGKDGIHTTVVCPYFINTGMFDGVKTRFPAIMPIVEPADAVDKIIEAILSNQHLLFIPRSMYLFYALKGILPVKCTLVLGKFFGVSAAMDEFKGRTPEEIGKKD